MNARFDEIEASRGLSSAAERPADVKHAPPRTDVVSLGKTIAKLDEDDILDGRIHTPRAKPEEQTDDAVKEVAVVEEVDISALRVSIPCLP